MKIPAVVLAIALAGCFCQTAEAARPDTRSMTCATAQAAVRQYNSIVMTTGPHTYARIVSGRGYCSFDQETALITAPTLDHPACRVGFICRSKTLFND